MKSLNQFSTRLKLTVGALLCLSALLLLAHGEVLQAIERVIRHVAMSATAPQRTPVTHYHSAAAPVSAPLQTGGGFTLPQTVTAGGGGDSSGGTFQLQSTSGQSLTGVSSGGQFSLESGFWHDGIGQCSANAPATPTITPSPASVCANSTGNTASGPAGATTYVWTITNGTITSAANLQDVTYTAGASGNVGLLLAVTNASGCGASNSANVPINALPSAPTIVAGGPTTFCAGGNVLLTSSSATGNQWYLNGNPIGGATNQAFSANAAGSYTVIVTTSGCSSAASTATTVTVIPLPATPTITAGGPATFCAGGSVTLNSNSTTGNQWYLGGNPIGGATNQAYSATAAGNYTVVVTALSCPSAASAATTVTVNPIPPTPTITAGGARTFCAGGNVTLNSSSATGNQWYLNGNPIGGATSQAYSATAAGNYTVVVTALSCPSAASAATTVTVNPIPPTPTITAGGATTFCAGGNVTLNSSSATGNQWYLNGNPIGGATNQAYVAAAAGNYMVVVTALSCPSAASAPTPVTVNPTPATPTITAGGATTFCAGGNVTLNSSSATGNQWYLGGNPIGGATSQAYSATAAGSYTVVVTASGCPSAASTATTVTVNPTPAMPTISAPGGTVFCASGNVTLNSSSATGNQWYLGGNPIGGATSQAYSATAAGSYTVVVTASGCPSAPSTATVVTANTPPTLVYPAAGVALGGSTTNSPTTATDNGTITGYAVQSQGTYTDTVSVNSSGVVSFSNAASVGMHTITIRVTDNCNATTDATFTLTVSCAAVTVTNPATTTGTAGTSFSQTFTQSGGVGATTFSTTSTLPTGLMLANDGTLSGTPQQTGTFPIVVKATDSNGCMGNGATYTLDIGCPTAATLPTSLPNGTGGTAYNANVAASPSGTYAYSVSGTFPNGLTLNTTTGAITGTPALTGTFAFTVTATRYGSCTSSQAYSVTITCPTLVDVLPKPTGPTMNPSYSLPSATAGANYSTTIAVAPVGGNPAFALIAAPNVLPTGLTLNANTGTISGTTTVTGSFVFRIQATAFGTCVGSRLYSLKVNASFAPALAARAVRNDFDGDGKSDLWSYRAVDGRWLIQRSSDGSLGFAQLGSLAEIAVPADYDGDGKTDVAVFNAATQRWLIAQSSDGAIRKEQFGTADAQAYPADYDGDGQANLAVRTASGEWQIRRSADGEVTSFVLGAADDLAVIGDFDGDGLVDVAVYRASERLALIRHSSDGAVREVKLPYAEGLPMAADFDGDSQAELAFWSATKATLSFTRSSDQQEQQLTLNGAALLLGDYDGDGRSDCASWQASGWQLRLSSRHWERP